MSYIKYCKPRPRANNRTQKLQTFVVDDEEQPIAHCENSYGEWVRRAPLPSCELVRCIQRGFSKRQPESATNLDTTWRVGDRIAEQNWQ
ncbi:hypothetical protein PENARI_c085G04217 [Penicillium arizonense]|uniref:Uncharacterized protein n=1 Tax=Penicillium arizonense TaxID=1835702 RepID=A0A1F5L1S0_PENAI|nr:hypothetical protein PENARI_c085G04217 [Penicillium arizonense]OGE46940.1 hypothetical protein PENARI_c085G04217 [Penicillium arizonense]